jgi:hypothetical protein
VRLFVICTQISGQGLRYFCPNLIVTEPFVAAHQLKIDYRHKQLDLNHDARKSLSFRGPPQDTRRRAQQACRRAFQTRVGGILVHNSFQCLIAHVTQPPRRRSQPSAQSRFQSLQARPNRLSSRPRFRRLSGLPPPREPKSLVSSLPHGGASHTRQTRQRP